MGYIVCVEGIEKRGYNAWTLCGCENLGMAPNSM